MADTTSRHDSSHLRATASLSDACAKIRETYSDSLFNRFEPVTPPEEEIDKKLQEINKTEAPKTTDEL